MPDRSAILAAAEGIARDAFGLAVVWHVVVGATLLCLFLRRKIGKRNAGSLLMVPIASVSLVSLTHDSPFNGIVLLVVAAVGAALALRLPDGRAHGGPRWARRLGAVLVGLAWVYPHFSTGRAWTANLYGAPMGVLPCPTAPMLEHGAKTLEHVPVAEVPGLGGSARQLSGGGMGEDPAPSGAPSRKRCARSSAQGSVTSAQSGQWSEGPTRATPPKRTAKPRA